MKFWHDFPRESSSNFAAERYGIDFDRIFLIMAAKNLVAEHYESRFWHDIPLYGGSKLGCRVLWIFHFNVDQNSVEVHYEI